jgi:hypothetical protein
MQDKRIIPAPLEAAGLTIHARTMLAAADIAGGIDVLAEFLQVQRNELLSWMGGAERPPEKYFLAAVDILWGDHETLRKAFHPDKGTKVPITKDAPEPDVSDSTKP